MAYNTGTQITEFTKLRITYTIALLAALFALSPILEDVGDFGYELFGFKIEIQLVYYILASLLGITVYLYGIELISERPFFRIKDITNFIYVMAILIIPLYVALYLATIIASLIALIISSPASLSYLTSIATAIAGVLTALASLILWRKVSRKERKSLIEKLSKEESPLLPSAKRLFKNKDYNIVVIECFRAIDLSIRKALYSKSIQFKPQISNMLSVAQEYKIISQEDREQIESIRKLRNQISHLTVSVIKEGAEEILKNSERIISSLRIDEDQAE